MIPDISFADSTLIAFIATVSIAYLIGSIPFGLVFGKLFKIGDIRAIGSGNIGATNALRTGNKLFALLVLIGDASKGALAIILLNCLYGDTVDFVPMTAGMAAIIGHIFPIWLRFKGGKGVATALGVAAILSWPTALAIAAMWLVTARLSRYSSLAAILAFLNAPIYAQAIGATDYTGTFAMIAALLIWTHRGNLQRLVRGEESIINLKKKD